MPSPACVSAASCDFSIRLPDTGEAKRGEQRLSRLARRHFRVDRRACRERFQVVGGLQGEPASCISAEVTRQPLGGIGGYGAARGDIGKQLTVRAHKFSGQAADKIAAAGGATELLA